ncbi:MAG: carboxyltransferase domain-containing protein [Planktotalea sp.]|uniref:5-oxoprolinase subunit B family protein n=1 Tax=Planktotalea sp. TaxID=2029877 RepID=UPI003C739700
MTAQIPQQFPAIAYIGVDGVLVRFGDRVSEDINAAALRFHQHIGGTQIDGVLESAPSLTAVYLRLDIEGDLPRTLRDIEAQVQAQDWFAPTQMGGRLWTIPCCFDGPQLAETAELVGLCEADAVKELTQTQVRVLTIGFAPGQPYLGNLPERWNFPRLSSITPNVPARALVAAVSQLVIFANDTPTGWRHIGTTEFYDFQKDRAEPFAFKAGDLVQFAQVGRAEIDALADTADGLGGARCEVLV